MRVSGSCVVAGDYDNDGDLDLFVGGRVVPTKYPMPAKSTILRNDKGVFTDVTKEVAPELDKGGLVCGAIWTDYNADNKLDLMIIGEWMPVTLYKMTEANFPMQLPPQDWLMQPVGGTASSPATSITMVMLTT